MVCNKGYPFPTNYPSLYIVQPDKCDLCEQEEQFLLGVGSNVIVFQFNQQDSKTEPGIPTQDTVYCAWPQVHTSIIQYKLCEAVD